MFERFFPHFQPIIELSKGQIAGYEALARTNLNGNVVSAGNIFNDNSLSKEIILDIDRKIRKQALNIFSRTEENGFITINVSPRWIDQLDSEARFPTIDMILEAGIAPDRVVIEITEIAGNIDRIKQAVSAYQKHGLRIAIDDFGAGASQLDRLAELDPDFIKLDMKLLKEASMGGVKADIALSIAALAKRAGSQIICEGVETEAEFHFAIEAGADFVQGWLFHAADDAMLNPDSTIDQTMALKQSYLTRKMTKIRQSVAHKKRVFDYAALIADMISRHGFDFYKRRYVQYQPINDAGILRYYLLNEYAEQISPNYELMEDSFFENHITYKSNWSHRPYFSLMYGMRDLSHEQLIVSDPYKDIVSGKMCKTFGKFLDDGNLLLIDALVDDIVLFANEFTQ